MKSDLIGETTLQISELFGENLDDFDAKVDLTYKDQSAGELHVRCKYKSGDYRLAREIQGGDLKPVLDIQIAQVNSFVCILVATWDTIYQFVGMLDDISATLKRYSDSPELVQ